MENLKVWDKIYKIYSKFWGWYWYVFDEVERITKTLIITKEWRRLANWWYYWVEKSNYRLHQLLTDEILKDNERIERENKIENWFYDKKFTLEEKIKIYELFNS